MLYTGTIGFQPQTAEPVHSRKGRAVPVAAVIGEGSCGTGAAHATTASPAVACGFGGHCVLVVVGGMSTIGRRAAQIASSYRGTLLLGSAVGACSAVLGLLVTFYADLAPGAAIVLPAIGLYGLGGSDGRHHAS